jgi:hypothetical protein
MKLRAILWSMTRRPRSKVYLGAFITLSSRIISHIILLFALIMTIYNDLGKRRYKYFPRQDCNDLCVKFSIQ